MLLALGHCRSSRGGEPLKLSHVPALLFLLIDAYILALSMQPPSYEQGIFNNIQII
jgi:hypothetical protein